MTALLVIIAYLGLLLALGYISSRFSKGTASDFFLASRSIGPFLLLMTLFGTTMTAFALVGSTGEAYHEGIGVYGLMASISGIVHSAIFFFIGIKLWTFGKKYGYVTQVQYFRDRFESNSLGLLLFPILVILVLPYLLIGLLGGGAAIFAVTSGPRFAVATSYEKQLDKKELSPQLKEVFAKKKRVLTENAKVTVKKEGKEWLIEDTQPFLIKKIQKKIKKKGEVKKVEKLMVYLPGALSSVFSATNGGVPPWLGSLAICIVVLLYISFGGIRGAAWANAFQTTVFMILGIVAFWTISSSLGGVRAATAQVANGPHKDLLIRGDNITLLKFTTYMLIPLSVGMFPHIFQHWLTAKSAKAFRLPVIAHPVFIMIVWVPCVLIGVWASSAVINGILIVPVDHRPNTELAIMIRKLTNDVLTGLLSAGILAAIMSSLDSQFMCLGTMFTQDIVLHYRGEDKVSGEQQILYGRLFIVGIVAVTYLLSLFEPRHVFTLGIWCFTGFSSLFPLVFASLYWKRTTKAGACACILTAAIVWGLLFFQADFGANRKFLFYGMMPVVPITLSSTIALIVVSLFTRGPSQETIDKFFSK